MAVLCSSAMEGVGGVFMLAFKKLMVKMIKLPNLNRVRTTAMS